MNDDELRRRLLDSVEGGGNAFWRRVDRSLADVEATDSFVVSIDVDVDVDVDDDTDAVDDAATGARMPRRRRGPVPVPIRARRRYGLALAAAAVAIVAGGAVAAGLFADRFDEVATDPGPSAVLPDAVVTTQPPANDDAAAAEGSTEGETTTDPIELDPTVCYLAATATTRHVARVEATGNGAFAGVLLIETGNGALPIVDRFVGSVSADTQLRVDVTRFDGAEANRRNAIWTLTDRELVADDLPLDRVDCVVANVAFADAGDPAVIDRVAVADRIERTLELQPTSEGSAFRQLEIAGVNVSAGEVVAFTFDADVNDVATIRVESGETDATVIVAGPAGLALAVDPTMNVTIPHSGQHVLVLSTSEAASVSVMVALS